MNGAIVCLECGKNLTEGKSVLQGNDWTAQIRLWTCINKKCLHYGLSVIHGLTEAEVEEVRKEHNEDVPRGR